MTLCLCNCGEELPGRLPGKKERKYVNKEHAQRFWNKKENRKHKPAMKIEYKQRARRGDKPYPCVCPACPPGKTHMVKFSTPPAVTPRIFCDKHALNRCAEDIGGARYMSW